MKPFQSHQSRVCILVRLKQYRLFRIQIACSSCIALISRYSRHHVLLEKTKTTISEEILSIPVGFLSFGLFFREKIGLFELERL